MEICEGMLWVGFLVWRGGGRIEIDTYITPPTESVVSVGLGLMCA